LSIAAVWAFTLICSAAFVASTLIFWLGFANPWPLYLALPVLVFIGGYSFAKRFTALAHFWLGASLFLAPVAAWIAIRGMAEMAAPLVLGGAVLFWVSGFDILYACQDEEFDRKAKLRSVPAALGVKNSLRVALGCHLVMLGLLVALYFAAAPDLGWIYLAGVGAVALLLIWEHSLVRADNLSRVNQAFFQVNAIISLGLFGVVLLQLAIQA
jgi:4-hydroxybenzoate polyprenyltransferase